MPESRATISIDALTTTWPDLPADYLAYLRKVGAGPTANGRMIYGGPIPSHEIYGEDVDPKGLVLLGDDLAGYCLGYDFAAACYGEVTPDGSWQAWPVGRGLAQYVGE